MRLLCVATLAFLGAFVSPGYSKSCGYGAPVFIDDKPDPCEPETPRELWIEAQYFDDDPDTYHARFCCPSNDSDQLEYFQKRATACRVSECMPENKEQCSKMQRWVNNTEMRYEEIMRETCKKKDVTGFVSLCCRTGSLESVLSSTRAASPHEFPHQAYIAGPQACGGTVYNERHIITAAHHLVQKGGSGIRYTPDEIKVVLATNIGDNFNPENEYEPEALIIHQNYSDLNENYGKFEKDQILFDVGVIRLKTPIQFSSRVKALPLAPPNFNRMLYAKNGVMIGWGTTITNDTSMHFQKYDLIHRPPCSIVFGKKDPLTDEQTICAGGTYDGEASYQSGHGDSGGPLICRGEDGHPVLCGLVSFSTHGPKCDLEKFCQPSVFASIDYFRDWFTDPQRAGKQNLPGDAIHKPYLYGQDHISKNSYAHQVHISGNGQKSCGGTLVAPDVVITAASCVAKSDKGSLQVTYGIGEVNGKGDQNLGVKDVQIFDGFKLRTKRIVEGMRTYLDDEYYENDLAILKLSGKAPITADKLPRLANPDAKFSWGSESSFPRNTTWGADMRHRLFNLMERKTCQEQMDRVNRYAHKNIKIDDNVNCGVEEYSGGSSCDRELGGGLICRDEKDKEVLCGVQVFRMCEKAVPNGFMDIGQNSAWIKKHMLMV